MKKTLFSLLLIMAPVVMFAQLKVHRNGNVTIGQQTQSKISKLSIGGTVTTDGIVVPIRINAKDMSKSLNNQDGVNTLSSMMSVGVFSYSIPSEAIDDEKATPSSDFHYAISPDELQSLFPSLVCEDSDGTKSINYTELVNQGDSPHDFLQRQANGKYVRGVQGIRISKELAKNSMRVPNNIGKGLGGLSIGLNAVDLYKDPTIGNVLNLGRSIGSYYSLPYALLDLYMTGSYYEIQNAIENRHGFPGTYSGAVTGYYMLSR